MHLKARPATAADWPAAQKLCFPTLTSSDPEAREARRNWDAMWDKLNPQGIVLENLEGPAPGPVGLMVTQIVNEPCFEKLIAAVEPPLMTNLRRQIKTGLATPMTDGALANANAGDGCHLLLSHLGWPGSDELSELAPTIRGHVVNAYAERHGGHRLKIMFGEVGAHVLGTAVRYGSRVLNDYGKWAINHSAADHPQRPYVVGVTKQEGLSSGNFWLHRMFTYFPPKFAFSSAQRHILLLAREGYTDTEIAELIGTTPDAVKKRWSAIYQRVQEVFPSLIPEKAEGARGAEKRRALLNHLRDRPEELRPCGRIAATRAK